MRKPLQFRNPWVFAPWISVLLILLMSGVTLADPGHFRVLNKERQGERFNVMEYLAKGKLNVIEFTSRSCPYSEALAVKLTELTQKTPDLVLSQLLIDRSGVQAIDWQSPLARQYELHSVPYFQVYDKTGKLVAEGESARKMISQMMLQAKIL